MMRRFLFESLSERTWTVDGVERTALVSVPPRATREKTPLVFVFHGHGGSSSQASRSMPFHTAWPDALVVYPQGLPTPGQLTDPTGRLPGWQAKRGDLKDRDLAFFDAMRTALQADFRVDPKRVFATGHSNGGGFTYLLWAHRGTVLRAAAPSSAIPDPTSRDLPPKPALHLAGENDPLVRYNWQRMTIDRVKRINRCESEGKPWAKAGTLVGTRFDSATGNPLVTLIHPGGHNIPSEATPLIVRFFKEIGDAV